MLARVFQYTLTVALSPKQIMIHLERTSKMQPFIYQYNWKETGKSLNQIINQLLLIFYIHLTILKK